MAAKKGSKKPNKSTKNTKKQLPQEKNLYQQFSKEIWGVLCLILAIVIVFSSFGDGNLISNLFKGLLGPIGLIFLPLGLVLCFVALMFHGGRPVTMRIICSLSFVILVSCIAHLSFGNAVPISIGELYARGKANLSGGVLGGGVAIFFSLIGGVAAWIISLILLIVTLLASLNLTLTGLLRAINNKRASEPKVEKEHREPAEVIVEHISQRRAEHNEKKQDREPKRRFAYDLPVDEPPAAAGAVSEPKEKPRRTDGPTSPDEYIRRQREEKAKSQQKEEPASSVHVVEETESEPKTIKITPLQVSQKHTEEQKSAVEEPLPPLQEEPSDKLKKGEAAQAASQIAHEIAEKEEVKEVYVFPPINLLAEGRRGNIDGTQEMRDNTKRLKETLECFNVDAQIINVTRGPSVTMYELELAQGVRLNRLTGLADDIALSLGAASVRISAIPDKISVVGIEVPNKLVSTVSLREVVDSSSFRNAGSRLSFAVGKDISGNCIIGDISKLPHMLIAGTTGSGKSVCMNSLIISLLYKSKPEEVRLIMVDPKMVELGIYNGIPHLLIPVVTDPKKAAGALQWTVTEMMRRYRVMADAGVRDLESYNKQALTDVDLKPMEQIVVVIDELADLMIVAAKEVEESICRIAQMGRASGIHLIIATQRPSADVITGLMKANIPSRIAFAVSSAMESRIILDTTGAEKLVGKGDMLFAPLGKGKPKRVQGCFVSDDEVQKVTDFIKQHGSANYSDEVQAQIDLKAEQQGNKNHSSNEPAPAQSSEDGDELLPAAVEVILETGQASVSMLQRRLKLGYARAARIVDEMEERGIVGPFEGSKPRQLLVTKEQWHAMQAGEQLSMQPEEAEIVEES